MHKKLIRSIVQYKDMMKMQNLSQYDKNSQTHESLSQLIIVSCVVIKVKTGRMRKDEKETNSYKIYLTYRYDQINEDFSLKWHNAHDNISYNFGTFNICLQYVYCIAHS